MSEWKVLRKGKLWSDRFNSEALAECHVEECLLNGFGEIGEYEILEMNRSELSLYEGSYDSAYDYNVSISNGLLELLQRVDGN